MAPEGKAIEWTLPPPRYIPPRSVPSPPPLHELADAAREFLAALDDPRHIASYVDLGEGVSVMDKRAKLEAVLRRV